MVEDMTNLGEMLIAGLREAVAYERGEVSARTRRATTTVREARVDAPPSFDSAQVRLIRKKLDVSQPIFAAVLGVSERTVAAWEQGRRRPDNAARRLLEVVEAHPETVLSKVHQS